MSYLQHGHIEQAFYERSDKSYLTGDSKSYLPNGGNTSFLVAPTESYLTASNSSYLDKESGDNKSYLDAQITSYLTMDYGESRIEQTNKSFMEDGVLNKSYLDLVAPSNEKAQWLEEDRKLHVEEDRNNHLDEDNVNHLEESGGETSDDENEDFSHTVDWSLVVPPYITPIFDNGVTKYKCQLTNRITNQLPSIPERFDLFDFDKSKLIETIGRYHLKKNKDGIDGKKKYRQLMKKQNELHSTELQSVALENLRVWKHKKEQELLGQVGIQNADYSDRTERMGVGDASAAGAQERKRRREALKKKQEEERKKQLQLKQRLKQEKLLKSQEELVNKKIMAQQRQQQQQNAVRQNMQRKQQEEMNRKQLRDQQQNYQNQWVKFESKNIASQRKQDRDNAMISNVNLKLDEQARRKQQRIDEQARQQNYVKVEQKLLSEQRQKEIFELMNDGLEEKRNYQQAQRDKKKEDHSSFLSNVQRSQQDARANISNQRSDRFQQQERDRINKANELKRQKKEADEAARRQEAERLKKMEKKNFITKINNLLDTKSCGIDFDDFGNSFYFKYNLEWNPEKILGLRDLEDILRSNGLQSTVEILRGGMTRRAISRKHYQKIKIVSNDTNDILTVLAISDNIDGAIFQLRQMINQREAAKREKERAKQMQRTTVTPTPYGMQSSSQTNYSQSNNWGLPRGWRVKKTAGGRLFFVNDKTKSTQWDDPRPMPRGWRSGKTPKGRTFYINDATKTTQWDDPRPKIWI